MDRVRIGDICEILNGFAFKSENYVESGIRIIRIANVQKGFIEDSTPVFYPNNEKEIEKYRLESGDLLMSLTGNVGRVAILTDEFLPAALNQRVACLRMKSDRVSKGYLYHILNSNYFENQCIQAAKGVAQKNMSTEWLKEYEIPLFPKSKQTEIVSILDSVSSVIAMRQQQLSALDDLIKARFVEMFGDEMNPYQWPVVNVEDVANVSVGVVIKPAQYYTDAEHGVKAFRSLNIGAGTIKDSDWVYFSHEGNDKNSKSQLRENDLLIVRSGAPGTACVIPKVYEGCNAIDIIIARPETDKVNPYYLCTYTNLPHGKRQIDEGTGGAAQQHFNVGKYNKLQLMLPPLKQQNEFVSFLEQIDKSKSVIQKSLDETQLLFDSLMQEYFG